MTERHNKTNVTSQFGAYCTESLRRTTAVARGSLSAVTQWLENASWGCCRFFGRTSKGSSGAKCSWWPAAPWWQSLSRVRHAAIKEDSQCNPTLSSQHSTSRNTDKRRRIVSTTDQWRDLFVTNTAAVKSLAKPVLALAIQCCMACRNCSSFMHCYDQFVLYVHAD